MEKVFKVYDSNCNYYGEFVSNKDCGVKLNIEDPDKIWNVLNGERIHHKDYFFIKSKDFSDEKLKELIEKYKESPRKTNKGRGVIVYKDGQFIERCPNKTVCKKKYKISDGPLNACLNGIRSDHKGYSFKYE